jgi:hypothetical protein
MSYEKMKAGGAESKAAGISSSLFYLDLSTLPWLYDHLKTVSPSSSQTVLMAGF